MLLRPAEPADAMAVAYVHVRAWQVAYRDLLPADYLASLKPEDRAQRYTFGGTDPRQPMTTVANHRGHFLAAAVAEIRDQPEQLHARFAFTASTILYPCCCVTMRTRSKPAPSAAS